MWLGRLSTFPKNKNIFRNFLCQACAPFRRIFEGSSSYALLKNMYLQGFAKANASEGAPNLISLKKMHI
jgi:hypothetical protein